MSQFTKWAAEMDRAASAVEAESDGSVQVLATIDGNRAIAEVLRHGAEIEDILLELMAFCGAHGVTAAQRTVAAMEKAETVLTMTRIRERQSVLFQESAADKAARGGAS